MPVHVNYMLVLNHKQTKLNFINTRFTTTVCPPRQNSFQSSNLTLSAERHSMSLVCTHNYVHVHRAKKTAYSCTSDKQLSSFANFAYFS